MFRTLIVEPQEFCVNSLLNLPVWEQDEKSFTCTKIATNGEEALKLIQTMSFDLVLTEINLPLLDGLNLLKKAHRVNQIPLIVFISDIASFSYAREVFICGAFDYLEKPVTYDKINDLFKRASQELTKIKNSLRNNDRLIGIEKNPSFSMNQISRIVNGFLRKDKNVLLEFHHLMEMLSKSENSSYSQDVIANKMYIAIINQIYEKKNWISLYLPQDFHKNIDYLSLQDSTNYIEYYQRKLTYLFDLFDEMELSFQDKNLDIIYSYLLNHPEEDLKLTTIANIFYLNHTYLSNLFSKKYNIRYSQLVTKIKIKRAEFLLNYSELSISDISEQLGYKDVNYFTRLFKATTGKHPSTYIHDSYDFSI